MILHTTEKCTGRVAKFRKKLVQNDLINFTACWNCVFERLFEHITMCNGRDWMNVNVFVLNRLQD